MNRDVRQQVAERAGFLCEYCRTPNAFSTDDFAVEHILPRVIGGTDELNNLAWSCQGCNSRKFTATTGMASVTGETVPLFHPRTDEWQDHFCWNDAGTQLVGLTSTGRATIERMQLNRTDAINIRRALIALGEHP
ncbi:MAG: hypothetical protein OHK0029_24150 [Armatimonadaceae bacterium]